MSLSTFIVAATTKFKIDKIKIEGLLFQLRDEVGIQEFSLLNLGNIKTEGVEFIQVIEMLVEHGLAEISYVYECFHKKDQDVEGELPFICNFCKHKVDEQNLEHRIETLFELTKELCKELSILEEDYIKDIVGEDFFPNLKMLRSQKNIIIPFLGAGISTPFDLPDWGGLFKDMKEFLPKDKQESFSDLLSEGDYFGTCSFLKQNSATITKDIHIQEYIADKLAHPKMDITEDEHNMRDIVELNSDFYLTTNYDNLLINFFDGPIVPPILLPEVEDTHRLFADRRGKVIHVHGNLERPRTMIVTEENYEELYKDQKFIDLIKSIMASKKLVYIGFSFKDEFFVKLHTEITQNIGGEHFIISPNIDSFRARKLAEKHNLRVISFSLSSDNEIRKKEFVEKLKAVLQYVTK